MPAKVSHCPAVRDDTMEALDPLAIPRARYTALRSAREAAVRELERYHERYGQVRLLLGLWVAYSGWRALGRPESVPWELLVSLAVFFAVAAVHARAVRRMELAQRAVRFYDDGLRRLDGDFSRATSRGEAFADPHHLFSGDLDLFGEGGLFERICHARTREGEATLAGWLLKMEGPPAAPRRMEAADELAPRLELREQLAGLGPELRAVLRPALLREWAASRSGYDANTARVLYAANGFSLLCLVASVYFWILGPLALAALVSSSVSWVYRRRTEEALEAARQAGDKLRVLEGTLHLIESGEFTSDFLREAQSRIRQQGEPASTRIARLAHLAEWIDSLDNAILRVLNLFLLFSMHFVRRADTWRRENGALVDAWLIAAGEFEAVCSLAAWEYENPDLAAPEWAEGPAAITGTAMRHPLLARRVAVANDAELGPERRLLLISGSNMSGKSTFLRTLGLHIVLAHAGARVPAATLRLTPLVLGASIRTTDSIQEGASRFYAELQRLKAVVEASRGDRKLLFLLDELLSGTNSHDRRIGAEAIVAALLGREAIGLVTTHDLALASIAERPEARAVNVHFDDRLVDGRIVFDYRMKPGVVKTSNALALMRAVGLEVPGE